MVRIAFRFDDPSPVSKRHVEERLFDLFFSRRIPLTCAVIPARMRAGEQVRFTWERAGLLREAVATGLLDVALHGFLHRNSGLASPSGSLSEFAGVPAHQQAEWIAAGRALLEDVLGARVEGFIPPWNSHDINTVRVIEAQNFSYLSAGLDRPPPHTPSLRVLPSTCNLGYVENTIRHAAKFARHAPWIVVNMHHYDFDRDPDDPPGRVFDYAELAGKLDRFAAIPEVRFMHLAELAQSMTPAENRVWEKQLLLQEALPRRFGHWVPRHFFFSRLLPS